MVAFFQEFPFWQTEASKTEEAQEEKSTRTWLQI
jgi:hypothetical protein